MRDNYLQALVSKWLACAALCVALAFGSVQANGADRELYYYEVPLKFKRDILPQRGEAIEVRVKTQNPERFAQGLTSATLEIEKVRRSSLQVLLHGADTLGGTPQSDHRAASFLVDFDDPAVVTLSQALSDAQGGEVTVPAMIDFVHTRMGQSAYMQSFDIASVVATEQTGDCTEHALLLTAIARAQGFSARAVIGSVIVSSPQRVGAYGHAWSEIWVDDQWQVADATVPAKGTEFAMHYLPVGAITNEGMGYLLGLIDIINIMPQEITKAQVRQ